MGTPTYKPQNDPHDALIILNIQKWDKNFFTKNLPIGSVRLLSAKVRPGGQVRGRKILCVFQTFFFEFSTKF